MRAMARFCCIVLSCIVAASIGGMARAQHAMEEVGLQIPVELGGAKMQRGLPEPMPIGEKTLGADGVEFLGATYNVMREKPEMRYVGITGYRGHFVRLAADVTASSGAAGAAVIEAFVVSLARLMSSSRVR